MDPKRNIEVLKEIRNISHIAIQQEQAIQREQKIKKAKKVHSKTTDLVSGYQEQNLESGQSGLTNTICTIMLVDKLTTDEMQTITNMKKNNKLSIEVPILEAKAKTDKGETITNVETNEETCTQIEIEKSEREGLDHRSNNRTARIEYI
ncbi:42703_t:CDS:1 [Gigaspora margarita]|uniref:42703_t:CDS:1 n=1 Tax=Gigaspora margarita TaxID=4874 RepID=A0ABN7W537_GIGMA|nr:42703_t:CDS:1 [Gigaspora margarita]